MSENDFEYFARTGENMPATISLRVLRALRFLVQLGQNRIRRILALEVMRCHV
jgi:hypothetical protein